MSDEVKPLTKEEIGEWRSWDKGRPFARDSEPVEFCRGDLRAFIATIDALTAAKEKAEADRDALRARVDKLYRFAQLSLRLMKSSVILHDGEFSESPAAINEPERYGYFKEWEACLVDLGGINLAPAPGQQEDRP